MFESQVLVHKTTDYSLYSPWFARQADSATFTLDVTAAGTNAVLEVRVFTKNNDDIGDGLDADTNTKLSMSNEDTGRDSDTWEGKLKELVRYKITVKGGTAGAWKQFRMLPPVWFDAVEV